MKFGQQFIKTLFDKQNVLLLIILFFMFIFIFSMFFKNNKEGMTTSVECKFDAAKYSAKYPDLQNAFHGNAEQLKEHYKVRGIDEGRSPCGDIAPTCKFEAAAYSSYYIDLEDAFHGNAEQLKQHYTVRGIDEGRSVCAPNPLSSFGVGQAVNCYNGALDGGNTGGINGGGGAIYRYTGNNTINHYTDPTIAGSWDGNWFNPRTIDCAGINVGPNMENKAIVDAKAAAEQAIIDKAVAADKAAAQAIIDKAATDKAAAQAIIDKAATDKAAADKAAAQAIIDKAATDKASEEKAAAQAIIDKAAADKAAAQAIIDKAAADKAAADKAINDKAAADKAAAASRAIIDKAAADKLEPRIDILIKEFNKLQSNKTSDSTRSPIGLNVEGMTNGSMSYSLYN